MRALRNYLKAARYYWQEYKVAAQFAKPWDDVADATAAQYRLANWTPPAEAAESLKADSARGSWRQIERVEIEPWFFHEIGRPGDFPSVFATLATLAETNIAHAVQFYSEPAPTSETRTARRRKKRNPSATTTAA